MAAIFVGRVLFEVALRRSNDVRREDVDWRAASWIWPWLIGLFILGLIGRYGKTGYGNALPQMPEWIDLAVVVLFSLAIFYYAVSLAMDPDKVRIAVAAEERQLTKGQNLNLPG